MNLSQASMVNNTSQIYINCLNALRVVLAFNVLFKHFVGHYAPSWSDSIYYLIISGIPNVPLFFAISGFLLYQSWLSINKRNINNKSLYYLLTKLIRVYPAIWFSFFVSIIGLVYLGVLNFESLNLSSFIVWVVAQLSFFQYYNPDFLRGFGVGVLNGSLWTIAILLQFFLVSVVIFRLIDKYKSNSFVLLYFILVLLLHYFTVCFFNGSSLVDKIFKTSIFNYLVYFSIGVVFRIYFDSLKKIINFKYFFILVFLNILLLSLNKNFEILSNDLFLFLYTLPMVFLIFNFSYIFPNFLSLFQRKNLSYGIFIWHMIFINLSIEVFDRGENNFFIFVFCLVMIYIFSYFQLKFLEGWIYKKILKKLSPLFERE